MFLILVKRTINELICRLHKTLWSIKSNSSILRTFKTICSQTDTFPRLTGKAVKETFVRHLSLVGFRRKSWLWCLDIERWAASIMSNFEVGMCARKIDLRGRYQGSCACNFGKSGESYRQIQIRGNNLRKATKILSKLSRLLNSVPKHRWRQS